MPRIVNNSSSFRVDTQTFTSNGTWNKPAGALMIRVVCIGAGGGGGPGIAGAADTVRCGGSGGGGGAGGSCVSGGVATAGSGGAGGRGEVRVYTFC